MANPISIPQHLDEPDRYAIFTADEFFVIAFTMMLSIALDKLLIGIFGTFVALYFYNKVKAGLSLRRVLMKVYWHAPPGVLGIKRAPDSVIRHWIG